MQKIDGDGTVKYGHNVEITYFAQDQAESLDPNKSILETVDAVAVGDIRKDLRSILGSFLFTGEDVDKKVSVLSGGERTRLALCLLLLSPSNFLILDEPTNHLDIKSKEVLKEALKNYEGTFIVVSHDREFLENLTNRIWDIEDKGLKIHHFGVKEFLARKMTLSNDDKKTNNKETKIEVEEVIKEEVKKESVLTYEEQKELKKKKTQLNNQVKKAEEQIEKLEAELKEMDQKIAVLDYSDEENSAKLLSKYEEKKKQIDIEMEKWENATEELLEFAD
jgi:ATP-binding cassette subfamily F protein 3